MSKTLDAILDVPWVVVDLTMAPYDLIGTLLRNKLPRSWKENHPSLACRAYRSGEPHCMPAKRYTHKLIFKLLVCPTKYERSTGLCKKYWDKGKGMYCMR